MRTVLNLFAVLLIAGHAYAQQSSSDCHLSDLQKLKGLICKTMHGDTELKSMSLQELKEAVVKKAIFEKINSASNAQYGKVYREEIMSTLPSGKKKIDAIAEKLSENIGTNDRDVLIQMIQASNGVFAEKKRLLGKNLEYGVYAQKIQPLKVTKSVLNKKGEKVGIHDDPVLFSSESLEEAKRFIQAAKSSPDYADVVGLNYRTVEVQAPMERTEVTTLEREPISEKVHLDPVFGGVFIANQDALTDAGKKGFDVNVSSIHALLKKNENNKVRGITISTCSSLDSNCAEGSESNPECALINELKSPKMNEKDATSIRDLINKMKTDSRYSKVLNEPAFNKNFENMMNAFQENQPWDGSVMGQQVGFLYLSTARAVTLRDQALKSGMITDPTLIKINPLGTGPFSHAKEPLLAGTCGRAPRSGSGFGQCIASSVQEAKTCSPSQQKLCSLLNSKMPSGALDYEDQRLSEAGIAGKQATDSQRLAMYRDFSIEADMDLFTEVAPVSAVTSKKEPGRYRYEVYGNVIPLGFSKDKETSVSEVGTLSRRSVGDFFRGLLPSGKGIPCPPTP